MLHVENGAQAMKVTRAIGPADGMPRATAPVPTTAAFITPISVTPRA